MLLQEIGRFGDNIEGLKPTDLMEAVPEQAKSGNVGIYWHVGKGQFLIFRANVLDNTLVGVEPGQDYDEESNPEDIQLDFNRFHKEIWGEQVTPKVPEWKDFTFDHFSRGRVIFEAKKQKFVCYTPNSSEFKYSEVSEFLRKAFNIPKDYWEMSYTIYRAKKDAPSMVNTYLKQYTL